MYITRELIDFYYFLLSFILLKNYNTNCPGWHGPCLHSAYSKWTRDTLKWKLVKLCNQTDTFHICPPMTFNMVCSPLTKSCLTCLWHYFSFLLCHWLVGYTNLYCCFQTLGGVLSSTVQGPGIVGENVFNS